MKTTDLLVTVTNRYLGKVGTEESGEVGPAIFIGIVCTPGRCFEHNFQAEGNMGWVS